MIVTAYDLNISSSDMLVHGGQLLFGIATFETDKSNSSQDLKGPH